MPNETPCSISETQGQTWTLGGNPGGYSSTSELHKFEHHVRLQCLSTVTARKVYWIHLHGAIIRMFSIMSLGPDTAAQT
jgi:hypothetical protein